MFPDEQLLLFVLSVLCLRLSVPYIVLMNWIYTFIITRFLVKTMRAQCRPASQASVTDFTFHVCVPTLDVLCEKADIGNRINLLENYLHFLGDDFKGYKPAKDKLYVKFAVFNNCKKEAKKRWFSKDWCRQLVGWFIPFKSSRQFWVFPTTAVNDNDPMFHEARRYASFHNCPQLPPDTWINRLVRAGYYFDDSNQAIICFSCAHRYPSHADNCHRQMENIPFYVVQESRRPNLALDIEEIARDPNIRLRFSNLPFRLSDNPEALSGGTIMRDAASRRTGEVEEASPSADDDDSEGASAAAAGTPLDTMVAGGCRDRIPEEQREEGAAAAGTASNTMVAGGSQNLILGEQREENGTDRSTEVIPSNQPVSDSLQDAFNQPARNAPGQNPTSIHDDTNQLNTLNYTTSTSAQQVMSGLAERQGSYSNDWIGPCPFLMADCGLYQVSTDSAQCYSCLVTFRGLTSTMCIWSLHRSMAPHCQFLRTKRGG